MHRHAAYDAEMPSPVQRNARFEAKSFVIHVVFVSLKKCHPTFKSLGRSNINALNIKIEHFEHLHTGAMHYHMEADDPENVFLVALRTVPTDSTGVAHILEHTALCGSERFPVRDPSFMMLRRSLNTFSNSAFSIFRIFIWLLFDITFFIKNVTL